MHASWSVSCTARQVCIPGVFRACKGGYFLAVDTDKATNSAKRSASNPGVQRGKGAMVRRVQFAKHVELSTHGRIDAGAELMVRCSYCKRTGMHFVHVPRPKKTPFNTLTHREKAAKRTSVLEKDHDHVHTS
jgi:hypothetical protein